MRLLSGDEDQLADPLIASREGISSTPAYRGLGLLVLEDFDLSTFGNRIPQITAEVDAGDTDMDAMALAAEILQLPAAPRAEQPMIGGFALQGDRKADCLAPLTDTFRIPFAFGPDGWVASREPVHHVLASTDELLIDRTQDMASEVAVPTTVSIRYFDASMDFAAGEKAARLPGEQRIRRIEFPGVLSSDEAISLAHHQLAAAWHGRRQTRVSMPLARCHGIRLGDAITVAGVVGEPLRVIGIDLKEGRADLLLRPALKVSTSILSEAGAVKRELDLRPEQLKLALVELPEAGSTGTQKLAVAMAGGPQPWRRLGLEIKIAGSVQDLQSADLPAVFGKLLQPLNAAPEAAFDERNHLEVQLDHDEWLVGVEDPELLAGANPARVGDEWLQFGTAEALGKGHYRLGRLVRRKYGTATTDRHEPGTDFLLIAPGRLAELQVPLEMLGSPMSATAYAPDGSAMTTQHVLKGQAALPLAPVHMFSRWSGAALQVGWTRRSRQVRHGWTMSTPRLAKQVNNICCRCAMTRELGSNSLAHRPR